MLKMLRYDFYKIFKSKALLGVFVASVILSFVDALLVESSNSKVSILLHLNATLTVQFLPIVFVASFVCKDYSSKFIKNIYSEYSFKDKIYYVLSKVVFIFAACVIWYVAYFRSYRTFVFWRCNIEHVPFVFEGVSDEGDLMVSVSQGMLSYLCVFMNAFAIGTIVMFLSLLMKKEYFALIVVLLYWLALSPLIYSALNKVIDPQDELSMVEWFTVFGMQRALRNPLYIPDGEDIIKAGYKRSLLICFGYAVLFILLSCLVVAAKRTSVTRQTIKEDGTTCLN